MKTYGEVRAVNGVDLTVAEGEVFALLGPNGAGKSTIVEILEGHRTATAGTVRVLGMNPETGGRDYRERIGIVLQETAIENALTVREAIDIYGALYPRRRPAGELIEIVGLEEKADARIKTLSGGQRRRLELALGIVGDPELLFLDEPTTGFDPVARRESWKLVQNLCAGGTTVLLTTHYLDEAEQLADRVGVLAGGRLIAEGTPAQLMATAPSTTISFELPAGVSAHDLAVPAHARVEAGVVRLETEQPTVVLAAITAAAVDRRVELGGLSVTRPSLEDVFLQLGGDEPASAGLG